MEDKVQQFSKEFFGKSMEFLNLEFESVNDGVFVFLVSLMKCAVIQWDLSKGE